MSNSFFRFKQFTVHQEHCAMKVCTDACLFGAWMAEKLECWQRTDGSIESGFASVLDIGTGTGLLSLLIAQAFPGSIDAVELDEAAASQAADNFEASPWRGRLQVLQGDIRTLHLGRQYDLIISNPPFYEKDLKTDDARRNLALHSDALSLSDLIQTVSLHLSINGRFALLLPWHRKEEILDTAAGAGLFAEEIIEVRQTEKHGFFRVMLCFGRKKGTPFIQSITIREGNVYSDVFARFLSPYYLML